MTKESSVFFLGIVLLVLPYLGVPEQWKVYVYTLLALLFIFLGYTLRQQAYIRSIEKENGERDTDSFVEKKSETINGDVINT